MMKPITLTIYGPENIAQVVEALKAKGWVLDPPVQVSNDPMITPASQPSQDQIAKQTPDQSQTTGDPWVVVVGERSMSSCYGMFTSYDDAVSWLHANGWHPADCEIRPVRSVAQDETKHSASPEESETLVLLPCPFCGAAPDRNHGYAWCYEHSTFQHGLIQAPLAAWNRRAPIQSTSPEESETSPPIGRSTLTPEEIAEVGNKLRDVGMALAREEATAEDQRVAAIAMLLANEAAIRDQGQFDALDQRIVLLEAEIATAKQVIAALPDLCLVDAVRALQKETDRRVAQITQERDDWRLSFETANQAIGKLEAELSLLRADCERVGRQVKHDSERLRERDNVRTEHEQLTIENDRLLESLRELVRAWDGTVFPVSLRMEAALNDADAAISKAEEEKGTDK